MSSGMARCGSRPSRYSRIAVTAAPSPPAAPARRRGDEQPPERAGLDGERDLRAVAAAGVGGGSHAELRVGALVHAARGAVAGFIDSGTHVGPPFEFVFEARHPARVAVLPRCDAEHALEGAQQPVWLLAEALGEGTQVRCIW